MRNVMTASYLMNMGEINRENAVNGPFHRAFKVATVQVPFFDTDRRPLSE